MTCLRALMVRLHHEFMMEGSHSTMTSRKGTPGPIRPFARPSLPPGQSHIMLPHAANLSQRGFNDCISDPKLHAWWVAPQDPSASRHLAL